MELMERQTARQVGCVLWRIWMATGRVTAENSEHLMSVNLPTLRIKTSIQAEIDSANRTPAKIDFHSPVGAWNSANVCRKLARYTTELHNKLLCTITSTQRRK